MGETEEGERTPVSLKVFNDMAYDLWSYFRAPMRHDDPDIHEKAWIVAGRFPDPDKEKLKAFLSAACGNGVLKREKYEARIAEVESYEDTNFSTMEKARKLIRRVASPQVQEFEKIAKATAKGQVIPCHGENKHMQRVMIGQRRRASLQKSGIRRQTNE